MQTISMEAILPDTIRYNIGLPNMPQKYIPIIDLLLVAWVVAWGALGGLGGAAVESFKTKVLPPWSRLVLYSIIGIVGAVGAFAGLSVAAFVLEDGAVDMLKLAGYSIGSGVGVAAMVAGVNIKIVSKLPTDGPQTK